jgi:hypothetical protein
MFDEEEIHAILMLYEDTEHMGYERDLHDPSYYIYDDEGLGIDFCNDQTKDSIEVVARVTGGKFEWSLNHDRGVGTPYDFLLSADDVSYKYILEHLERYKPQPTYTFEDYRNAFTGYTIKCRDCGQITADPPPDPYGWANSCGTPYCPNCGSRDTQLWEKSR